MGPEAPQLYLVHTPSEPRDDAGLPSSDEDKQKKSDVKHLKSLFYTLCQNLEMIQT
jgi:hypothetical protein